MGNPGTPADSAGGDNARGFSSPAILSEEGLIQTFMARIRTDLPPGEAGALILNAVAAEIIQANAAGLVSDEVALNLQQEVQARRHRQAKAALNKDRIGFFAGKAAKGDSGVSVPDEIQDETPLRIRRYLGRVASVPALIASLFTVGEQAVLSQIAIQCRTHGACVLTQGQLAYRARVSERTVRNALTKAKGRFITVKTRGRLASIITVVSQAWRDWWSRSTAKAESKKHINNRNIDPPQPAKTCHRYPEDTQAVADPSLPAEPVVPDREIDGFLDRVVQEIDEDAPEPEPKPSAPVLPTSIGHGPRPVSEAAERPLDDFLNQILAKVAQPPAPEPPPGEPADPSIHMRSLPNETHPEDQTPEDEWDNPMVSQGCMRKLGGWFRDHPTYYLINAKHWPNAVVPGQHRHGRPVMAPPMLRWLESRVGQGRYGFKPYVPETGPTQVFLGFKSREDAETFRLIWGGR